MTVCLRIRGGVRGTATPPESASPCRPGLTPAVDKRRRFPGDVPIARRTSNAVLILDATRINITPAQLVLARALMACNRFDDGEYSQGCKCGNATQEHWLE